MHTHGSRALHDLYDHPDQLQATASSLLVPLSVTATAHEEFSAGIVAGRMGQVAVARIRSAPHTVSRTARLITSTDPDLVKVTLHHQGSATVTQGHRQHPVTAGRLVALDTARPYELAVAGPCDVTVIGMPRALLGPHADRMARCTAQPLAADTGTCRIAAAFLTSLDPCPSEVTGAAAAYLGEALASLLIAAFTGITAERVDTAAELADRIMAYVPANLCDPALCLASVAQRHGISTRHLQPLFQRTGVGFATWLRYERLRRVRRDLQDPRLADRTVAAVAARWGMSDPRHVGRALKAQFGQNAADLRRHADGSG
ncbi:helix-turn-helix domain-containing protein [Streptomyces sp. NPDC046805]|uniref:AraC-like ligand-binding domain-containing protein n=1 Tax=Streptomyces sp. NPDC046805 TaxID=3155134 RepID=UPI0033D433FC